MRKEDQKVTEKDEMMSCSVKVVMRQMRFIRRKGRKRVEWIKEDKRQQRQNHKNILVIIVLM